MDFKSNFTTAGENQYAYWFFIEITVVFHNHHIRLTIVQKVSKKVDVQFSCDIKEFMKPVNDKKITGSIMTLIDDLRKESIPEKILIFRRALKYIYYMRNQ
jgi:hypothetical protein